MSAQDRTRDCDERCRGCVRCYRHTGDTKCDECCPHAPVHFPDPEHPTESLCWVDKRPHEPLLTQDRALVTCEDCRYLLENEDIKR